MAKKSNCPPVSQPKASKGIFSGGLTKLKNAMNAFADTVEKAPSTIKASARKSTAKKSVSKPAAKRTSTKRRSAKTEVIIAPSGRSGLLPAGGRSGGVPVVYAAGKEPKSVKAKIIDLTKPATKTAGGRKLNSTQRKRLETGEWKSFGTPKQSTCSAAGRSLRKGGSWGGKRLPKCKTVGKG